jgi:predicted alpha/beta superfamily hydrolase
MGGLISLYAFFHRPDMFGFTGAMSPSLWFASGAIFDYIEQAPFAPGKIYLDVGTNEESGPPGKAKLGRKRYPPDESNLRRMAALLESKGYRREHDLLYIEEEGARHRETAWARRLPDALRFLLGYHNK